MATRDREQVLPIHTPLQTLQVMMSHSLSLPHWAVFLPSPPMLLCMYILPHRLHSPHHRAPYTNPHQRLHSPTSRWELPHGIGILYTRIHTCTCIPTA